eukprot:Em0016g559a
MDTTVQKHWRATQERVEKYISDTYFTDVNLRGRLYSANAPLRRLRWHKAVTPTTYDAAVAALESAPDVEVSSVCIGPAWSTHWFRCEVCVPAEWVGKHIRFCWDSGCEAMIWYQGKAVQGLTGSADGNQMRTDFTLVKCAQGGETFVLYLEAAANGMFGTGHNGLINPPDPKKCYSVTRVEIAVFEEVVNELLLDLAVLFGMSKYLPSDSPRAYEALYTANDIINACNPFDKSTLERCLAISRKFFSEKNGDAQHTIHAIGHCHIDTAWLWPYSETVRKCARSWSTTLRLMEKYPEYKFACSQAQQFEWVKLKYPSIYEEIKAKVATGQFIPVGGTWVEMDGNIPSGESFVRQFLVGQRFFKEEFGAYCKEFWLPDTFGYSAQLPQIMNGAGIKYFLTQKLSWNLTNTFPHNTFFWEGIDGTRILTHFPPANTYSSNAGVEDVVKTVKQFLDKGRSRQSILLFGHGDGGGGPTEGMLELVKRMANVDGLPKVVHSSPEAFYSSVEKHDSSKLCTWKGELYLELHRGTYTSQARLKRENRKIEILLHDMDFVAGINVALRKDLKMAAKRKAQLLNLWKLFLLNQFHDVLPGSSIDLVTKDALAYYSEVKSELSTLLSAKIGLMLSMLSNGEKEKQLVAINTFSWPRQDVVHLPAHINEEITEGVTCLQTLVDESVVALVSCGGMSVEAVQFCNPTYPVVVSEVADGFVLDNNIIRCFFTKDGSLKSVLHKQSNRDAIEPGRCGNQFVLYDDIPLYWDAWDVMEYHLETRKPVVKSCTSLAVVERGPLRASLKIVIDLSERSHLQQFIILDANCPYVKFETFVEWHESHKFLKVEFPLNVRAMEATYEIQFGHITRPTHSNTSWDQAKFEVCGLKWADLSDSAFGVALLDDCKYGYSTRDNVMSLSLLRSPKAPDKYADMGLQTFSYALLPHQGTPTAADACVIQESYNFNNPLRVVYSPGKIIEKQALFEVSVRSVILETVKMCEDDKLAIVIRLYEAYGGSTRAAIRTCLPVTSYQRCNLLEEPLEQPVPFTGAIELEFKPFQIINILLNVS